MQFRRETETAVRPGRRRDPAVDEAVKSAVLALLTERGWDGVSMDGVAARAGVGKASIYRRWSSRVQMVAEAVTELNRGELTAPDTGSLREDLLVLFRSMVTALQGPLGTASRALIGVLPHEPDLAVAFREGALGVWAEAFAAVFAAAAARGDLDRETLGTVAGEAGPAVLMQRWLITGQPLDDALAVDVVDHVVLPLLTRR
ncbi:hypothetical protein ASG36_14880 [Geodermatophilus sp. Leaf369]|uniref:TetR/AcrR family transcriptional regulator n=1 Tax=Geodermatophilus sp. Leaf369 TaxID=1736354 RepID=UPI0006FCEDCA|nr:TetR/AcrR family transcriptional regulator [Geodermatophilus sp. Leaf369]KQS57866.1 hypothetical protein ASG36_14880 [Geodermatophilus sp. Leaf369]